MFWRAFDKFVSCGAFALMTAVGSVAAAGGSDMSGDDPFAAYPPVESADLDLTAGTGIDVEAIGVNLATNNGTVADTTMSGTFETGRISNNNVSDMKGINSMMFNTGNNVNFQNNMQVNVFLK